MSQQLLQIAEEAGAKLKVIPKAGSPDFELTKGFVKVTFNVRHRGRMDVFLCGVRVNGGYVTTFVKPATNESALRKAIELANGDFAEDAVKAVKMAENNVDYYRRNLANAEATLEEVKHKLRRYLEPV